ncbi:hypothetical protein OG21DRAFT_1516400 [Imleria badia]|nr:hypothetical protein OG21DRAFT_1516400 [Imleria badia]
MGNNSLESAVISHLTGLQRHLLDSPTNIDYGWRHCLSIANNWDSKKKTLSMVAGRLPAWKAALGTEEEPRRYTPTREPRQYRRYVIHA